MLGDVRSKEEIERMCNMYSEACDNGFGDHRYNAAVYETLQWVLGDNTLEEPELDGEPDDDYEDEDEDDYDEGEGSDEYLYDDDAVFNDGESITPQSPIANSITDDEAEAELDKLI